MSTTTKAMGLPDLEETPEEKEERIRKNRQAGMAKTRAKLQEKRENGEIAPAKKVTKQGDLWENIFLTFMRNHEVKGTADVPRIIKLTDDTIEILKKDGRG